MSCAGVPKHSGGAKRQWGKRFSNIVAIGRFAQDVSGGRGLSHFAGQENRWLAMVGGGRPAKQWRPVLRVISLERREAEG
jgi:hypothetical protein